MTCVCVNGEEIRTHGCIHAGAETLEEAAIRGSPGEMNTGLGGSGGGIDILLFVYICI